MHLLHQSLITLHIIAGFSSLLLFWLPALNRKGGINHRRIGKMYVRLMWVVVISAALLSIENFFTGQPQMAAFLGFIALATANPIWYGVAILNNKKGLSVRYRQGQLAFNIMLALAGVALIGYGIALNGKGSAILMFIFGTLGISAIPAIIRSFKQSPSQTNWLLEHISGMCISGIAAYTAFFVFGANQFFSNLLPGYWAILPWVAPTIIGVVGIHYAKRKYQPKKVVSKADLAATNA